MSEDDSGPPPREWRKAAKRWAHIAWLWLLGVSFVGFWAIVAAAVWLDARPLGRLIWEPPAAVDAGALREGPLRR